MGPLLSLRFSRVPGGTGSLTRGLLQSPLMALRHHPLLSYPSWGEGEGGSAFLHIPGLVCDSQLSLAQKGPFPVSSRLSFFFCQPGNGLAHLKVVRQENRIPFLFHCRHLPRSRPRDPGRSANGKHRGKRFPPSLEMVDMSWHQGVGVYSYSPIISW